jgi:protein-glutamine gamma-glutamyltransferase
MWVSGTFGIAGTLGFVSVLAAAWFLDETRWQISERLGTFLIVAALPAYYLLWRYGFFQFADAGILVAGVLGRLILTLSAIKMLQRKADRDWIFLYLMAFFEVLLAAGLSISGLYFASLVLFVFVMVSTIITFEIRKTGRTTAHNVANWGDAPAKEPTALPVRRLPGAAAALIVCIVLFAIPLFFLLPRVGGAGLGGSHGGVSASSGFSDSVRLGGIGSIQQNDEVVMRVRVEGPDKGSPGMKWRGVALDTFDNRSWSRTRAAAKEPRVKSERDVIQLDYPSGRGALTTQTIYLEPLDAPVLFALPRAIGVQGNFPVLFKDKHDSVSFNRVGERISYRVLSDRSLPNVAALRADRAEYDERVENYLQLPSDLDPRISELAERLTANARNRFDAARTIETHLQNDYGYTLEMKASGGQPLADFLFNVREGHCEYFATAMAVMLRTQGIATRVVNGFSQGEYNETADVWVVRQKNAHSWVEVYFPGEDAWVSFDPTPFSGQVPAAAAAGITARFGKYLEALETFWIQYFVAFDNQEQRSLFTSVRRGFADYSTKTSGWMNRLGEDFSEWWRDVRGENGVEYSLSALGRAAIYVIGGILGVLVFVWLYRRIVQLKVWRKLWNRVFGRRSESVIAFYERMVELLAERGLSREPHQTPLEFARVVGASEALLLTAKYNEVRFGAKMLSEADEMRIESWLNKIQAGPDV